MDILINNINNKHQGRYNSLEVKREKTIVKFQAYTEESMVSGEVEIASHENLDKMIFADIKERCKEKIRQLVE